MTKTIWGKLIALGEYPHGVGLIEYEFPLGPERSAFLTLPRDVKRADVARLQAFMLSLVEQDDSRGEGIPNA